MKKSFVFFSFTAFLPLILSAGSWAEYLDFERSGAGYDSEMKEYPINEPIRINGGYRLISGAEDFEKKSMINAILPGMDSIPAFSGDLEKTFPLTYLEDGRIPALSMEIKGTGKLTIQHGEKTETFQINES